MAEAIRRFEWTATLGPIAQWPQPLNTLLGVMLAADQPMFLTWGPERTLLYNDAYAPLLADRHPAALGRSFFDVWPEIVTEITPLFERVFAGEPVHMADIELYLARPGRPREAHFAFSYTPVRDATGAVIGLFCACAETTEQVFAARRLAAEAERQRANFQQMPGFVATLAGPDHVFEYVNDAYVAVAGERDFVGRCVRDVFPELTGQSFFELLDQVYTSGKPFTAPALPISLAGEPQPRYLDFLYNPIRGDDGQVSGIFVGGYDVTERVRAQQRSAVLLALDERLRETADTAELSYSASRLLGEALDVV